MARKAAGRPAGARQAAAGPTLGQVTGGRPGRVGAAPGAARGGLVGQPRAPGGPGALRGTPQPPGVRRGQQAPTPGMQLPGLGAGMRRMGIGAQAGAGGFQPVGPTPNMGRFAPPGGFAPDQAFGGPGGFRPMGGGGGGWTPMGGGLGGVGGQMAGGAPNMAQQAMWANMRQPGMAGAFGPGGPSGLQGLSAPMQQVLQARAQQGGAYGQMMGGSPYMADRMGQMGGGLAGAGYGAQQSGGGGGLGQLGQAFNQQAGGGGAGANYASQMGAARQMPTGAA